MPISLGELTLFQKRIQGALFGDVQPAAPTSCACCGSTRRASSSSTSSITSTYTLDEINQGYEDMHAGKNIRGVIVY